MPDDEKHKWTKEQLDSIRKWLAEKWGPDEKCAQCGSDEFILGDQPAVLIGSSSDGKRSFVGSNYPCIAIVCENCGNTRLVNAIVAGLHSLPEKEEKESGNG